MSSAAPSPGNMLLSAIPPSEMSRLHPLLTRVRWVNGQSLHEAGEHIEHVFFVEQGFASMVAEADEGGDGVEIGLIGREGMVGYPVLLDPGAASYSQATVQMPAGAMPGGALRMAASALRDSFDDSPVLRRLLFQALQVFMAQVAQTAACNSLHSLSQRLARWLLLAHDRMDGDELVLTQDFLGTMLAVRRSGVTNALGALQAAGVVDLRRGHLTICDRPGLEAVACGCYGRVQAFTTAMAARNSGFPDPADPAA
ncbi:MAG: Crp/Fnr family transcriptional regulator [Janthinobacterium lividum]